MDNNNATEKFNTNMESSEPGLQDRLYLKLLGPTLESKKGSENVTTDFIRQYCTWQNLASANLVTNLTKPCLNLDKIWARTRHYI